jgi:hypothetical protein
MRLFDCSGPVFERDHVMKQKPGGEKMICRTVDVQGGGAAAGNEKKVRR